MNVDIEALKNIQEVNFGGLPWGILDNSSSSQIKLRPTDSLQLNEIHPVQYVPGCLVSVYYMLIPTHTAVTEDLHTPLTPRFEPGGVILGFQQ